MRALAVITVLTLLLAGCSGGGSGSDPTSTTTGPGGSTTSGPGGSTTSKPPSGSSTTAPPSSSSGAPSGNTAPVADLQAAVVSGPAPLSVTFLVNATDAEGDALTYNLTFGDGSPSSVGDWTILKEVARTYTTAGTYTAVLNISDGTTFGLDELVITVEGGSAFTPIQVHGEAPLACPDCVQFYSSCRGLDLDMNELDCFWVVIPPEAVGRTLTVTREGTAPLAGINVDFMATCDAAEGLGYAQDQASPYSTVLGEGVGCIILYNYDDVNNAWDVSVA